MDATIKKYRNKGSDVEKQNQNGEADFFDYSASKNFYKKVALDEE